jgi:YD repeat-containing protein
VVSAAFVLGIPAAVFGHAVVFPKASTTGAYERYVLRVPNERNVPTTKVELRFPADVRVTSFSDVPGWQLEVTRDSAQRIVGATWTGTLAPERFVEFPFVAVNPKTATQLSWPAYQTYANGERVEWTGAEGSKTPASVTSISTSAAPTASSGAGNSSFLLAVVALALAIISLGLSMRKRE